VSRPSSDPSSSPSDKTRRILAAFSRAFDREAHNLCRWPDLTAQQMTNRLQWGGEDVSRVVWARGPGHHRPWLRTQAPLPESEELVRILRGHKDEINACAVSPDGSFIVSAGGDQIRVEGAQPDYCLRVWDTRSGRERAALFPFDWPVTSCAVGPGGIIAAGAEDGVALWNPDTLEEIGRFHDGSFSCAFSPDGTFLVIAGFVLSIIDLPSGTARGSALCEGLVKDCAVTPDGRFVVTAGSDQQVAVWEAGTADLVSALTLDDQSVDATGCAVSPDGKLVAATTEAGEVVLWDFRTDDRAIIQAHKGWATSCAFHPGGSMLASTGDDALLKLWRLPDLQEIAALEGHAGEVSSCSFTPNGESCVTGSADHTVRFWNLKDGAGLPSNRHSAKVVACQFSTASDFAFTAGALGDVHLYDASAGRQTGAWDAGVPLQSAGLSPDGARVAGAHLDGSVYIWTMRDGRSLRILRHFPEDSGLPASTTSVRAWEWSPDGAHLVTTAWQSLRIWDLALEGHYTELEGHTGVLVRCVFTPDGRRVVSAGADGSVRLWDSRDGVQIAVFETTPSSPVNDLVVGPDGRWVAVAYTDRVVRVWDLASGADPMVLRGHNDWVERCVASPDGARLASSSAGGSVRLWSLSNGSTISVLPGQDSHAMGSTASRMCFSPDACWLAFDAGDGLLALARADNGNVEARIPIPGMGHMVALHPAKPIAMFSDEVGGVYPTELVGIAYGPLVVTAIDRGEGPKVRCPACFGDFPLGGNWLGREIGCPGRDCSARLKVNPSIAGPGPTRPEVPQKRHTIQSPAAIAFDPEDLETVDWGRLSNAFGSARSVPVFIRNLGSEDAQEREEALYALVMTILHQGSLFSATVAALPFLLRIVATPSHPARLGTMSLVREIVLRCRFEDHRKRKEALIAAGEDPGMAPGAEPDLVVAISKVLWADRDLLERLRSDEDPAIRDMVKVVLAELRGTSWTIRSDNP